MHSIGDVITILFAMFFSDVQHQSGDVSSQASALETSKHIVPLPSEFDDSLIQRMRRARMTLTSPSMRQAALDITNEYRKRHVDTPPLTYGSISTESKFTQQWADYLRFDPILAHSAYPDLGENIAFVYGNVSSPSPERDVIKEAFRLFYDEEIKNYYSRNGGVTGHFTQIVWKGSKTMTFAYAVDTTTNRYSLVFHFIPQGNNMEIDDEMDWLLNTFDCDTPVASAAYVAPAHPSTTADAPHVPAAFAAPATPSTRAAPDTDASKFALWLKSILAYLSVYITLKSKGMEGIWFTLRPNTSQNTGLYKSLGGHDNKNNGFSRDCRTNLGMESAMSPSKTTVLKGTYRFNSIIADTFLEVIIKAKYHDMIKSISEQDSEYLLSRKDKTFMVYVPSEASTKSVAQPKTLDAVQELFEKKNKV
eukprot:gene29373-biopygen5293